MINLCLDVKRRSKMNPNAWNENGGEKPTNNNNISGIHNETPIVNAITARPDTVGENYLVGVGSRTARFRRKKQQKLAILILIILLIVLLMVLIVVSHYASKRRLKLCETPQCIRSAANILLSIDETVDPCDDFYQYACGNWFKQHPKPDYTNSYDWFSDKTKSVEMMIRDILATNTSKKDPLPFNQAKQLYASCVDTKAMDEAGLNPIFDFLKSVDLPLLPSYLNLTKSRKSYKFDWWKTLVKIKKKTGMDVLIGFDVYPDPRNNSMRRLMIGEPSDEEFFPSYNEIDKILQKVRRRIKKRNDKANEDNEEQNDDLLDEDDDYDDENELAYDKDSEQRKELFKSFFVKILKEFLRGTNKSSLVEMPEELIDESINKTMGAFSKFGKQLYKITEELENATDSMEKVDIIMQVFDYSVDQLQSETDEFFKKDNVEPVVIWKPYLKALFQGSNVTLDFKKDLILLTPYDLQYTLAISLFLMKTPPILLELFLWIQAVDTFIPYTITPIRLIYEQYSRAASGVESLLPKSMKCSTSVSEMMGFAVAYGFVDQEFFKMTLPKVKIMLDNIKISLEDLIGDTSWMDLPTKAVSIEKVRNMKSLIGFPKWLLDRKKLEEHYKGLRIDPKNYIQNWISVKANSMKNKLNSYREPFVFGWDTEPTVVNAYHVFQANAITIPLVMLEYPFFDLGIEALNYGSLGTILGHELTHGFDNTGRQYDKDGRLIPWWTNKTIESYNHKTDCLAKQYSTFYINQIDKYVDGNRTLGENIADNGGLRTAIRGYRREPKERLTLPGLGHLSDEQLFFLSYGNLWCGTQTKRSLSFEINDEHAPSHTRLKGVLQNTPEFAKAWNCRANSTMNPSKKRCIVF